MFELSANLELLFSETDGDLADAGHRAAARVHAAAELGLRAVEIWSWRDKDIDRLAAALHDTGVVLQTMCVDPMGSIVDPATHEAFFAAVTESAAVADRLGCPYLVVTAGDERRGTPRVEHHQAIVAALTEAGSILRQHDATLLLENLNSRVDHIGTYLDTVPECLDILDEVSSPKVKALFDLYHSLVMDERSTDVLTNRLAHVGHVQIADVPGRHEPGTGSVDWRQQLTALRDLGYTGRLGLEYSPTTSNTAATLQYIRKLLDSFAEEGSER